MPARVLILVFSDLQKDVRVNRQIRFLKEEYRVEVVGYSDPGIEGVVYHPTSRPYGRRIIDRIRKYAVPGLGLYEVYYWNPERRRLLASLASRTYDLVIANDIDTLPLALRLNARKVLFDAHEYYPRQFEDRWEWRMFFQGYYNYLCRRYMKQAHRMTCVCQGIADEYRRVYGVHADVITNASDYADLRPGAIDCSRIRLIHHGSAMRTRKIENMIRLMRYTDTRFCLDLMLVPTENRYFCELQVMASGYSNVRFTAPVPISEVTSAINKYDIGLYLLEPRSFNTRHALPNKFFDFIQARLAIAVGPSDEMSCIVQKYGLGVIANDFRPESLAATLNGLSTAQIKQYKESADRHARELSAERNHHRLLDIVSECLRAKSG